MKRADITFALVMLVLSGIAVVNTSDLAYWDDFAPGPAFAARWVAAAGVLMSILLFVNAMRTSAGTIEWPDGPGFVRIAMTAIALAAFVFVVPTVGTTATAALFMLFMLVVVQRRRIVPSVVTTVITVALIEVIFNVWLKVQLPGGIVGF